MSARTTSDPGTMAIVRTWAGVSLLAFGLVLMVGAARAESQVTTRVSVATGGAEALGQSYGTAISADGRYVAFASDAANLVAGDTNGNADVFVHDRQTATTTRASVASSGGQGVGGHSRAPSLSADGRFVAFESRALSLVPGDTNAESDIFVRDRQSGTTERVSVATGGAEGAGPSREPSISADGRFVAFTSTAPNLVPNDVNGAADVFVHDRVTGTTVRVSVGSSGVQAVGGGSYAPAISGDGRVVAFASDAVNLIADDTNGLTDVFVHDRIAGSTTRVSVSSSGAQAVGGAIVFAPRLNTNGRLVVFASHATNLVPDDTNGAADVFLHDRATGATSRISVGPSGEQSAGGPILGATSGSADISGDGRFVTFYSYAKNLVPDDVTDVADVFLHDVATGLTTRLSGGLFCLPTTYCLNFEPKVSADGNHVAFSSNCTNLVIGDTNSANDIFVSAQDDDGDGLPTYWEATFGALIESIGSTPAQIVVERAMYSNASGVHWAAGTNATATRLVP
jgi:Tol biopolymer transport system component